MKKVEAIIRPEKFEAVKAELEQIGIKGMTVYQVEGRGEQMGMEFTHRAGKFRVDMLSKVKLDIVVEDEDEQKVVDAIVQGAKTGEFGDGKIFVSPIQRAIKIRTGEDWRYAIEP